MAQQVPAIRTPFTATEIYAEVRAAWRAQVQTEPERRSLLILVAQIMLETAWGARAICHNPGNFKHTAADGQDWCQFATTEVVAGQSRTVTQSFRAYGSLAQGVADYVHGIRAWYPGAWQSAEQGDVAAFAHALKLRGYYTSSEAQYAAGLVGTRDRLDALIGPDTDPEIPVAREAKPDESGDLAALDESASEEAEELSDDRPIREDG